MITRRIRTRKKPGKIDFFLENREYPVATLTHAPGGWVVSLMGEITICLPDITEQRAREAVLRALREGN